MKIIALLVCSLLLYAGDEPPVSPLLPDAVKILATVDKELADIDGKALSAKYELYIALVPKLVKAQETATKAGKLDAAQAAKAKVEEYKGKIAEIASLRVAKVVSVSKDVILYSQPGFKGPGTIVKQFDTIIDAWKINFPNDGLRSVRLPPGYTLVTYADNLGSGLEYTVTEESADLVGTPALGMTSFMVRRVK